MLKTHSSSKRFDHSKIIYCKMEISFKFIDGTDITVNHTLRPFNRSMSRYTPMNQNEEWLHRYAHEFTSNRDKFKGFFESFLEARKCLEEELMHGNTLLKFSTRYWACDESHACNARGVSLEDDECVDPVAAAKEVSTWVKHTMAYVG